MALRDVTRLDAAPVVGRFYLVPAIRMDRYNRDPVSRLSRALWWPVTGSRHSDAEFFNFPRDHYHLDARFINGRHIDQIAGRTLRDFAMALVYSQPVSGQTYAYGGEFPLAAPTMVRMRCARALPTYPHGDKKTVHELNAAFAGRKAKRGPHGWVCPHRGYLLGQVPPDQDGRITCPLHGLRLYAETGKCIGHNLWELYI